MQPVNWDLLPQRQMELLVSRGAGAGVGREWTSQPRTSSEILAAEC